MGGADLNTTLSTESIAESAKWIRHRFSVAGSGYQTRLPYIVNGREREQGPRRQEEDGGADQALPGRPPAVSLLAKITSHIFWRAARWLGQGLVGAAVFLRPPRSLLAVSPATSYRTPSPPTPRFAYDHIACLPRSSCVIRCLYAV